MNFIPFHNRRIAGMTPASPLLNKKVYVTTYDSKGNIIRSSLNGQIESIFEYDS